MRMRPILIGLIISLLLVGCSFIPSYNRPGAPIPEKWPEGEAYKKLSNAAPMPQELRWHEFLVDPKLQRIIELAITNNRDLRLAALRVEEARALYGVQRAELFPAITGEAVAVKERSSSDFKLPGKSRTIDQYSMDLGITAWEIDFFGRIRSLEKQALEEYLATEEARRSAQISLISEVARAYLTLAADREGLLLANCTLETQQQMYDLIQEEYDVGVANELDLRRAETQVESARRDVALYTRMVAQDKNALELLVGGMLILEDLLPRDLNSIIPPNDISAGLSSEVLLNRPDIMAAEHRLKAAYAFIGAARAAFFPSISLTTFIGVASDDLINLFDSGRGTWNFTPQMVVPIFDTRVWASYRVSKVERELALAEYERAIQMAFREVADTLAVRGTVEDQLAAQEALVNALDRTYELSKQRYVDGIDNYLSVLDAQRSLYAAQQELISLRLSKLANLVTLYSVLGGGGD